MSSDQRTKKQSSGMNYYKKEKMSKKDRINMIDNHVHVGWYTDGYHSPGEVWQAELEAGIDEEYELVIQEMQELKRLGDAHIYPILWLSPEMMRTGGLSYMLHSNIKWQGVKFHWKAHQEWFYKKELFHNALEVARWLQVPVLLHTGEFEICRANIFFEICYKYNDLFFVLAHGRPINETIDVLSRCPNTYVDTAFMPIEDIKKLVVSGFTDRILFGTDSPINLLFYKNMTTTEYIKDCLRKLEEELSPIDYNQIISNQIYGMQ